MKRYEVAYYHPELDSLLRVVVIYLMKRENEEEDLKKLGKNI